MELKELYQEIILDHGKNPRNKGKVPMGITMMRRRTILCVEIKYTCLSETRYRKKSNGYKF